MTQNREYEDWARSAAGWWEKAGARPEAALQFARLYIYSWSEGLEPKVTSIFRDPGKQKAMQQAWDRGERSGLRARPADPDTSKHCLTGWFSTPKAEAMDMPTRNDRRTAEIARSIGLKPGADFRTPDHGHYQWV